MKGRKTAGGLVPAFTLLVLALVPATAAGNPVPFGDIDIGNPSDLLLFLSLNFITNLFLFSAMFLVMGMIWRQNVGRLDPDRSQFVLKVLAAVFVITLVGSLIDLALLYKSYPDIKDQLFLVFEAPRWMLALVLVFISIVLAARVLLRIRWRVSLLIGFGMAAANLAYWFSLLGSYRNPGFLPLLMLFVTPFLLYAIRKWHLVVHAAPEAPLPEPAPEGPEPAAAEPAVESEPVVAPDDIEKAVDSLES